MHIEATSSSPAGPSSTKSYDVFLCHGSNDKGLMLSLRDKLVALGLRVFLDIKSLDAMIVQDPADCARLARDSHVVVVVVSKYSIVTRWAIAEANAALADPTCKVFPVFADAELSLETVSSPAWRDGPRDASHPLLAYMAAAFPPQIPNNRRFTDLWEHDELTPELKVARIGTLYALLERGLAPYSPARDSVVDMVDDLADRIQAIVPSSPLRPSPMPPPPNPSEYYPLPDTRDAVINVLLGANNVSVVGVNGLGGVGKSSLAADVAIHPAITSVFSVFWLPLGEDKTSPIAIASRMSYFLKQGLGCAIDAQAGLNDLQPILAAKTRALAAAGTRILLILDDAWTTRQASVFTNHIAAPHAVLVTSRNAAVATNSASSIELGTFAPDDAAVVLRNYLAKGSPEWAITLALNDSRIVSLATFCRGHALALAVLGSSISGEAALDAAVEDAADATELAMDEHRDDCGGSDAKYAHIFDIITWTLGGAIPERVRKVALAIYAMLAVFPSDAPIDVANFRSAIDASNIKFAWALDALANTSLLRVVATDGGAITVIEMHDLHLEYIRHRLEVCFDDIPSLAARHLAAVAGVPPPGATPESARVAMTSGTASDWIVTRGISHMIAAGANLAAVAVALSWPWMKARANDSLGGLLHDLRCVVRLGREVAKDVDEVERALSLSREIIESGTSHIETELVARLAYDNASNAVKDLVAAVREDVPSKALIPSRAVDPVAHRGAERFRFDGSSGNVINIGGSLVAGGCGKNVDVLDVQTGERVEVLEGHTSDVNGVIALPSTDGQLPVLVSWSDDDTIRVWHAADDGMGAMRYTADSAFCEVLEGHTKYVQGVIALPSADGQLPVLVSWSEDKTIRVWPADDGTGAMRYTADTVACEMLEGHTSRVRGVIALPSADSQLPVLVSWSWDNTIRVWHAADDGMGIMRYTADRASCEVLKGHTGNVQGVIALPSADGQLPVLVSWSWDNNTIRVWHPADNGTGAMRYTVDSASCEVLEGHTSGVNGVIALPSADGQLPVLVSWSFDGTIRVWHPADDGTGAMRYTADSASCEVLEGDTGDVHGVIALPSADSQLPVLVSWSWDNTIRVWHAADDGTGAMRYTADSAFCEVLEGNTSDVHGVIALPSADGQLPVLVSWSGGFRNTDNTIRVWHPADDGTGAMRYTADSSSCEVLEGNTSDVHGVIALPSADGQLPLLVSWSRDRTIRVWHPVDDEMGAMRYTADSASCEVLEGHTSWVHGVIALPSADGQLPVLVSWSEDKTIRVWHAADDGTGAMRYTVDSVSCEVLEGHTSGVRGVIALPSADGQLPVLVSWSVNGTIRVWHPADDGTGAMRYTADSAFCEVLEGHTSGVRGVIALPSADGQLPVLVSWSADGTIRVWHPADDGTGAMRYTADSAFCEVLEGHTDDVWGVIALPNADGQLPVLVSWSWDNTIRVWHAADDGTGAMRYTADSAFCEVLEGHTDDVEGVIALPSADGQLPVLHRARILAAASTSAASCAMGLTSGSTDQRRRMNHPPSH
ncbi:WD repeat protein [Thecamonas trahens ATCC 50062]|uniref:WD repeat protein n=1 Tax=Thecamonas trahens ATCC 50062 TaxID=461836 RepID=A0A0L0DQH0_THETB|nr:WD repeat protein [Thecamonas trahens ATCC 50062]KNC54515.1 WD repeat protein [Thecamonas trahens ATCC 50062]|eukprot:XP_013753533.1 WD repeat protein [Thecamonas trahens ATCC 50062]